MSDVKIEQLPPKWDGETRFHFKGAWDYPCYITNTREETPTILLFSEDDGHGVSPKMFIPLYLNREHARALIPILQRFADTGELGE